MDSMFNTLLARALAGGSGGGGGGTGTDDYTDLNNKPKVNNVTVVGNLTSSDLKLQGEITSSHKLSADLVDDSTSTNKFNVQADWDQTTNSAPDYIKNKPTLGTAAATDATAYATAAQGTKADSAIQTVNVNGTALTPTSAKAVNITVPTQASDINALPNTTKYAATLSLTIDSSTFVVTGQLKDQNGDNLGTAQTIDLPLESVVVGGSYDSQTKKVILTLQNGNTVEFSVADLVSGLQTELSATNKLNPSFINYDTTHAAVTESDKTTWSGKQDALTFDGTYSASTNKAATVSTVTNAVNALNVTGDASVSASKTISAWSETDGKVSISTQDIAIAGTQTTLTGYAKSGTAGQAVAATDNVNQAIGKLEATVDDNKNNISKQQDTTASGGNGYAIINGQRLYMSDTAPSGDIPVGSALVSNGKVWGYKASTVVNPTILSDGTAISDYNIEGNAEQNGTPTPSNPVDVLGVGKMSENLYNMSAGVYQAGARYISDGEVEINENYSIWSIGVSALSSGTYTFSLDSASTSTTTLRVVGFKNGVKVGMIGATQLVNMPLSITVTDTYDEIRFSAATSYAGRIMLNSGSTALPYEPYGYYLPVSSGNAVTNIPIGTVQTTRVIKKLVFDGTENWSTKQSGEQKNFSLSLGANGIRTQEEKSTHFQCIRITDSGNTDVGFCIISSGLELRIRPENVSTTSLDDFKTYLQQQYATGTPVIVWYVLVTPETTTVNEPLMGIGDFADSITATQSQTPIPTTAGENTITFGTTVQPSEFDITAWVEDVLTPEQEAALNSGITSTDVEQIETNKNDILSEQAKTVGMSAGGSDHITVNGISVYVSATQPTGDIPVGSLWIGG